MKTTCSLPHHPFEPHYCGLHSWAQTTGEPGPDFVVTQVTTHAPTTTEVPLAERALPAMGQE